MTAYKPICTLTMLRIQITGLILLFSAFTLFSGNQEKMDSLTKLLETELSDSTRYKVLVSLCKYSYDFDLKRSLDYGDEAYAFANAKGLEQEVDFLRLLVYLNDNSQRYPKSIIYLDEIIKVLSESNKVEDRISMMSYKGWLSMRREEYSEAIEIFQKGIVMAEESGHKDYALRFYYNLAKAYEKIGVEEKEVEYYNKYLENVEEDTKSRYVSMIYIRLGDIRRLKGAYDRALDLYFKAMELAEQASDSSQMIMVLNRIAWNYYEMDELGLALDYYHENIRLSKPLDNLNYLTNCYGNMGNIYRDWEEIDSSLKYYNKSIEISLGIDDYFNLAWVYKDLSKLYAQQGDYEKAYETFQLHASYNDTMITDEYRARLLEEQTKFESGKKEQELEILKIRLQRNRFLLFGLLGGIILLLFIAGMFLLQGRLKARQRMEEMNLRISELTQKNLRQQMNPHFIFNTLNSIQYYVFKNDKISSNNYMTKFAKLIRMTLENSRFTSIPIKEEIEALNLYLELESLRFKGKFDWEISVDEEIDTLLYKMPTMLIQPFVENSIGHGLMHKEGKGHISVDLRLKDEVIICTIEDNGIGREKAMEIKRHKEENHNSLGTTITESRINLVNSLYGQHMKVIYTDLKDDQGKATGTKVQITVPVMG